MIWSAEDSKDFCRIAGQSAKKLGYLPWQEVQSFLRDRLEPMNRRTRPQEFSLNLKSGEGPTSLKDEANTVSGHESPGTVVELREIKARTFFWETLREVAGPKSLKQKKFD